MKRFKKIYLEITNTCNLNCHFCNGTIRIKEFMSIEKFTHILNEIKDYTDYLYLHVMGEPLVHPNINEFVNIASRYFKINLTTNGILLDKIIDNKNIRQINISLHSLNNKASLKEELLSLLRNANRISNSIINYRLWIKNDLSSEIINILSDFYDVNINLNKRNYKIKDKVFISLENEFMWPNLENDDSFEKGTCLGLVDQIGILVDGTVVPCCLDSNGIVNLGNIFESSLTDILNKDRVTKIIDGFKNDIKVEKLCKKCGFYANKKNIIN